MAKEQRVVIEDGVARFVYDDDLASLAGEGRVQRASEVEPAANFGCVGGWVADMERSGGPVLTLDGPFWKAQLVTQLRDGLRMPRGFETREQALHEERVWLRKEKGL